MIQLKASRLLATVLASEHIETRSICNILTSSLASLDFKRLQRIDWHKAVSIASTGDRLTKQTVDDIRAVDPLEQRLFSGISTCAALCLPSMYHSQQRAVARTFNFPVSIAHVMRTNLVVNAALPFLASLEESRVSCRISLATY